MLLLHFLFALLMLSLLFLLTVTLSSNMVSSLQSIQMSFVFASTLFDRKDKNIGSNNLLQVLEKYSISLDYILHFIPSTFFFLVIPGRIIPKTLKMVLDTSLLNTQQYKVRIKGKVEQFKERSSAFPYTSV